MSGTIQILPASKGLVYPTVRGAKTQATKVCNILKKSVGNDGVVPEVVKVTGGAEIFIHNVGNTGSIKRFKVIGPRDDDKVIDEVVQRVEDEVWIRYKVTFIVDSCKESSEFEVRSTLSQKGILDEAFDEVLSNLDIGFEKGPGESEYIAYISPHLSNCGVRESFTVGPDVDINDIDVMHELVMEAVGEHIDWYLEEPDEYDESGTVRVLPFTGELAYPTVGMAKEHALDACKFLRRNKGNTDIVREITACTGGYGVFIHNVANAEHMRNLEYIHKVGDVEDVQRVERVSDGKTWIKHKVTLVVDSYNSPFSDSMEFEVPSTLNQKLVLDEAREKVLSMLDVGFEKGWGAVFQYIAFIGQCRVKFTVGPNVDTSDKGIMLGLAREAMIEHVDWYLDVPENNKEVIDMSEGNGSEKAYKPYLGGVLEERVITAYAKRVNEGGGKDSLVACERVFRDFLNWLGDSPIGKDNTKRLKVLLDVLNSPRSGGGIYKVMQELAEDAKNLMRVHLDHYEASHDDFYHITSMWRIY